MPKYYKIGLSDFFVTEKQEYNGQAAIVAFLRDFATRELASLAHLKKHSYTKNVG
jgi:hypothetical protein